ncbi:MAG: BamA/TamA family outer membrane protein [Ignavibacteria bacterium]|jgi:outer membrane protein insertion porin family
MIHLPSKLLLILLIFPLGRIYSQQTVLLNVKGNIHFTNEKYSEWSNLTDKKLSVLNEDTLKSNIGFNLRENGFYNYSFGEIKKNISADSSRIEIELNIVENDPTYINKVYFNEIDSIYIDDINLISLQIENQLFLKENVESTIAEIIEFYDNHGFPFVAVKIRSVFFFTDTTNNKNIADIYMSLEKGENSLIKKIEISGNEKTKNDVIIRALRLSENETFNENLIEEIPKRLNKLSFFEPVQQPNFYINSDNEGVLQISVKEIQTNNFDGIVGYVPSTDDGESGYFTGYVDISLRNLFGAGRAALFRWEQEDKNSQELELEYLEPWIFGYPFNLTFGLFQRKQDSTYVQRNFNAQIEFMATENLSASFIVESESTIPTENGSNTFTVYNSSVIATGVSLTIDTRDDLISPTSGIYFVNEYSFRTKSINGPEEFIYEDTETKVNHQRFEVDLALFYKLFDRQILTLGLHGKEMKGGSFEVSDLYQLGGTNTLRGYRESQFLGNRIYWSNLEYRFLLTKRSFVYPFFDTGYYLRSADEDNNITEISSFKIGYGFGLNIETTLGILGVSYALGEGDGFSEGKIHFGLVNEF